MKRREQALLLLRKAGQDAALLDEMFASQARQELRALRSWVESKLQERLPA